MPGARSGLGAKRHLLPEPKFQASWATVFLFFVRTPFFFVPPPEGVRQIGQYGRTLGPQRRASIGGARLELLRVVAVVVVVPLLLLVVDPPPLFFSSFFLRF